MSKMIITCSDDYGNEYKLSVGGELNIDEVIAKIEERIKKVQDRYYKYKFDNDYHILRELQWVLKLLKGETE